MKTLNILKGYFIGATIGIWSIIPFCMLGDLITGNHTYFDDLETILILIGWNIFSIVLMYIGYHLFRGIKNDYKDLTEVKTTKIEA